MYLGILNHMKKIINPWRRSAEVRLQGKNHEEMNEEKAKEMGFLHCEVEE